MAERVTSVFGGHILRKHVSIECKRPRSAPSITKMLGATVRPPDAIYVASGQHRALVKGLRFASVFAPSSWRLSRSEVAKAADSDLGETLDDVKQDRQEQGLPGHRDRGEAEQKPDNRREGEDHDRVIERDLRKRHTSPKRVSVNRGWRPATIGGAQVDGRPQKTPNTRPS
jgi:hypothetical protein